MALVVLGIFVTYSDSMEPHRNQSERPTISPLFVAALLSALTYAIWIVAPIKFLIGFLCILVSAAIGLLLKTSGLVRTHPQQPKLLQVLLDLSCDREISGIHASLSESLKRIANQRDPVFSQACRFATSGHRNRLQRPGECHRRIRIDGELAGCL